MAKAGVTLHTYVSPAQAVNLTAYVSHEHPDHWGGVPTPADLNFVTLPKIREGLRAKAPRIIVAVLPEQNVAIVQGLVYNGVYFAHGIDRKTWLATLESIRDDAAFETLLVGHGLPTTRGELDSAIAYLKTFDAAWNAGDSPDDVKAAMMAAYPSYDGAFLLGLIEPYWDK